MTLIDADKFLAYLIYSKHIDGLTCGEVKKAVEMCKVDVLDKIRTKIEQAKLCKVKTNDGREIIASADFVIYPDKRSYTNGLETALQIIDKYIKEE